MRDNLRSQVRHIRAMIYETTLSYLNLKFGSATTGESLANAFLDNQRTAGVNVPAMRGQGYDGAANMSGCHRGVKARIQQVHVVQRALNTHCKAHSLNLTIIHASKEPCET